MYIYLWQCVCHFIWQECWHFIRHSIGHIFCQYDFLFDLVLIVCLKYLPTFLWHLSRHFISLLNISSDTYSDILVGTYHLVWYVIWRFIWHSTRHLLWHTFWHSHSLSGILSWIHSDIYSQSLSDIYSDIWSTACWLAPPYSTHQRDLQ